MAPQKYSNKVQEYAARVGIMNQWQLRMALWEEAKVSEPTSRRAWLQGVDDAKNYKLIKALEKVLQVPAEKFLE